MQEEELKEVFRGVWATEQIFTRVFAGPHYILKWVRVLHKHGAMSTHEAIKILYNNGYRGKDLEL